MTIVRTLGLGTILAIMAATPSQAQNTESQIRTKFCPDGQAIPVEKPCPPVQKSGAKPKNAPPAASTIAPKGDAEARTTPPTAADRALARDISLIVADRETSTKFVNALFAIPPEQFFAKSPQMRSLERTHPGITALLLKRMQAWFTANVDDIFEGGIAAQTEALAQSLSSEDLQITADFLKSDAGQSFTTIAFSNLSVNQQGVSDEFGNIMRGKDLDTDAIFKVDEDAMTNALLSLPEYQQDAIFAFLLSPTGNRFLEALDEMEAARLKYVDQFMADHDDEIEALTIKVFEDYKKGVR